MLLLPLLININVDKKKFNITSYFLKKNALKLIVHWRKRELVKRNYDYTKK